MDWLDNALINARNLKVMEGESGFVDCSVGVDIIPYEAQEIEGTPFFMLNLSTGGTVRLGNHHDRKIVEEVARLTGARALMLPTSVSEEVGINGVVNMLGSSSWVKSPLTAPCDNTAG